MAEPYESLFNPVEEASPSAAVLNRTAQYAGSPLPTPPNLRAAPPVGIAEAIALGLAGAGAGIQGHPDPTAGLMKARQGTYDQQNAVAQRDFENRLQLSTQERANRREDIATVREERAAAQEARKDAARTAIKEVMLKPPTGPDGQPDTDALKNKILPHVMELSNNLNDLKQFFTNDRISVGQLHSLFPDIPAADAAELTKMAPDQLHKFIDTKTRAEAEQRKTAAEDVRERDRQRAETERERHNLVVEGRMQEALALRGDKPARAGTYFDSTGQVVIPPRTEAEAIERKLNRVDHGSNQEKVIGATNILGTHLDQALSRIDAIIGGDRNRLSQLLGTKFKVLRNDPDAVALFTFLDAATPVATSGAYAAQGGSNMRGSALLAKMLKPTGIQEGDTLRVALDAKIKSLAEISLGARQDMGLPTTKETARLARIHDLLSGKVAGGAGQAAPAPGTIQNGYRFKGGNPADKNSWEKQ